MQLDVLGAAEAEQDKRLVPPRTFQGRTRAGIPGNTWPRGSQLLLCITVVEKSHNSASLPRLSARSSQQCPDERTFQKERNWLSHVPLYFTNKGSQVSGRQRTDLRSQSCPEAELQLRGSFSDLKVMVVFGVPRCYPWRETDGVWATFPSSHLCSFVSLGHVP